MPLCVQYGCGTWVPDGWQNFDATPSLFVQNIPVIGKRLSPIRFPKSVRFGNIVKGLPITDGSADAVYCSHVLEHLAVQDMRKALRNTLKMLRPGGIFRLVLPDLKYAAEAYVKSTDPAAGFRFIESLGLGHLHRRVGPIGLLRSWLGNSAHYWMWDYESMAAELKSAGFLSIRRAQLGDSGNQLFAEIEQPNRWENALGMQCSKSEWVVNDVED